MKIRKKTNKINKQTEQVKSVIKGAEATSVKIAAEVKKCSRLKEMSHFIVL